VIATIIRWKHIHTGLQDNFGDNGDGGLTRQVVVIRSASLVMLLCSNQFFIGELLFLVGAKTHYYFSVKHAKAALTTPQQYIRTRPHRKPNS
jgi:hypothetical protein